ncbi:PECTINESTERASE [Salix purpurea]|uniref:PECTINESTERASE n=1 Tax=Salix purpurea TaxID=77065 RepID=A0A9Q0TAE2_SALPP|nr:PECTINESTERASE [Salix purpurea]
MHYKIPALPLLHLHPGHPSRAKSLFASSSSQSYSSIPSIFFLFFSSVETRILGQEIEEKMFRKVVVSAISLILVVGAVIGVVALVQPSQKGSGGENEPGNISPSMRIANQLCQPSDYKEACTKTLSSVNSTDPKEFVKQAILAASDAVKKSFQLLRRPGRQSQPK